MKHKQQESSAQARSTSGSVGVGALWVAASSALHSVATLPISVSQLFLCWLCCLVGSFPMAEGRASDLWSQGCMSPATLGLLRGWTAFLCGRGLLSSSTGRKAATNLDGVLKHRGVILPTKVPIVKAVVFPVVTYGCES